MTEQRRELAYDHHRLPSRFWEPGSEEEPQVLPEEEWLPEEELPFE